MHVRVKQGTREGPSPSGLAFTCSRTSACTRALSCLAINALGRGSRGPHARPHGLSRAVMSKLPARLTPKRSSSVWLASSPREHIPRGGDCRARRGTRDVSRGWSTCSRKSINVSQLLKIDWEGAWCGTLRSASVFVAMRMPIYYVSFQVCCIDARRWIHDGARHFRPGAGGSARALTSPVSAAPAGRPAAPRSRPVPRPVLNRQGQREIAHAISILS